MSNPLFDSYETDDKLEADGVWFTIDHDTGAAFKIRSMASKAVDKERSNLMRPYAAMTKAGGELSDSIKEEIATRLLANAILVDWKNVSVSKDSKAYTPFGKDAAYTLVSALKRLRGILLTFANEPGNFKSPSVEALETDAKN